MDDEIQQISTIENKAIYALLEDDLNLIDHYSLVSEGLNPWSSSNQNLKLKKTLQKRHKCLVLFKNSKQNFKSHLSQNQSEGVPTSLSKNASPIDKINHQSELLINSKQSIPFENDSIIFQLEHAPSSLIQSPSHFINNKRLMLMNKFNRINRKKFYSYTERKNVPTRNRQFIIDNGNFQNDSISAKKGNSYERWLQIQKFKKKESSPPDSSRLIDSIPPIQLHIKQTLEKKQKNISEIESFLVNKQVQTKSSEIQKLVKNDIFNKSKILTLVKHDRYIRNSLRKTRPKEHISIDLIYKEIHKNSQQRYFENEFTTPRLFVNETLKNLEQQNFDLILQKQSENKRWISNKDQKIRHFFGSNQNRHQPKFNLLGKIHNYINDHSDHDMQRVLSQKNKQFIQKIYQATQLIAKAIVFKIDLKKNNLIQFNLILLKYAEKPNQPIEADWEMDVFLVKRERRNDQMLSFCIYVPIDIQQVKDVQVDQMVQFNAEKMDLLKLRYDKALIEQESKPLKGFYSFIKSDIVKYYNSAKISQKLRSEAEELSEASGYYFTKEGKLVRPLLNILFYSFLKNQIDQTKQFNSEEAFQRQLNWAAVIEMLHVASLVHDDILDNASTRRGLPTAHSVYGKQKATFSANYIIGRAGRKISEFNNIRLFQIYARTMNNMTNGEYLQAMKQKNYNDYKQTMNNYIVKTYYKTAALIANSLKGVCEVNQLAHESLAYHNSFYVGLHLGIAFQLVDDVLDYTSDAATLGKANMSDLKEGYATGPVLFEYFNLNQTSNEFQLINKVLHDKIKNEKECDQGKTINFNFFCKQMQLFQMYLAMLHMQEGVKLLEEMNKDGDPHYKNCLLSLIYYILNRKK